MMVVRTFLSTIYKTKEYFTMIDGASVQCSGYMCRILNNTNTRTAQAWIFYKTVEAEQLRPVLLKTSFTLLENKNNKNTEKSFFLQCFLFFFLCSFSEERTEKTIIRGNINKFRVGENPAEGGATPSLAESLDVLRSAWQPGRP